MQPPLIAKFIALPLGIALLLAGLFFVAGSAEPSAAQALATPTVDRLAKPTLPASPAQADLGAQVYWLWCLPCHGEKGQGLTDEFRTTYPPEEQYCWERGCHGKSPYDQGFILPTAIPAVIGNATLGKFSDAAQLNAYIRAAMPYWKPGVLTEEEAWQVTAFLLRANGLWDASTELNASTAGGVAVSRSVPGTPAATPQPVQAPARADAGAGWIGPGAIFLLLAALLFLLRKRRDRSAA